MATLRLVPASGVPFELKGDSALVGREPSCDLVVVDGSVSRKHARLERRDGGWMVVDQGSANGTFVDSQRVAEAALRAGQELRFGAIAYRVEIEYEDTGTVSVSYPSPDATIVASPQDMPTPALGVALPSGVMPTKPSAPIASAPPPPLPKAAPAVARPPAPPTPPPAAPPRKAAPPAPVPPVAGAPSRPAAPPRPQAAAAPVGQMTAPPLEKKGRSPVFWIVTGCCGCLLLGVLLVMGIGGAAFYSTQAPATAVQDHLSELRRGDLDSAYRRLSGDLQAQLPPEEFERLVREHPGLGQNKDATFWNRSVNNDRAKLSGILTPSAGDTEAATFELVKEGGEWKITAIRVGSSSTP